MPKTMTKTDPVTSGAPRTRGFRIRLVAIAAVLAAAERGWLDGERAMAEALTSIRRAGADVIVTYWARQFARGGGG